VVVSLTVLIACDDREYGVLEVDWRQERRVTDDDANFLQGYANLLAAAVDRLRKNARIAAAAMDRPPLTTKVSEPTSPRHKGRREREGLGIGRGSVYIIERCGARSESHAGFSPGSAFGASHRNDGSRPCCLPDEAGIFQLTARRLNEELRPLGPKRHEPAKSLAKSSWHDGQIR
jgi:hypothetical protein